MRSPKSEIREATVARIRRSEYEKRRAVIREEAPEIYIGVTLNQLMSITLYRHGMKFYLVG